MIGLLQGEYAFGWVPPDSRAGPGVSSMLRGFGAARGSAPGPCVRSHAREQGPWEQSLPADVAFGPGFDQVMGNGNRRWHAQVRMLTPERSEDISTGEPAHIGHLFVVDADISGQGAGVTADH